RAAHEREQVLVARAPVEAEGLVVALGGATGRSRRTAVGVVHETPGLEPVLPRVGAQDTVPVDQDPQALLENVGVEAPVARGGLVPDLAASPLRRIEALFPRVEPGGRIARGRGDGGPAVRD